MMLAASLSFSPFCFVLGFVLPPPRLGLLLRTVDPAAPAQNYFINPLRQAPGRVQLIR